MDVVMYRIGDRLLIRILSCVKRRLERLVSGGCWTTAIARCKNEEAAHLLLRDLGETDTPTQHSRLLTQQPEQVAKGGKS